ncbi:folylpolyglutamate synthase [Planctomycetales bacterium]|nr:folylpolyglutamate synthase [Planctomycetales bacterium]
MPDPLRPAADEKAELYTRDESVTDEYRQAVAELAQYTNYERDGNYPSGVGGLGTAMMEKILARLNSPERQYYSVIIAGTKGKGSTAYLTASLLTVKNWTTGLFTSPHLDTVRERIKINGATVSPAQFAAAYRRVKSVVAAAERPTYFELLTAMALLVFAEAGVGIAVLEVGLGGRLDATNVAALPVLATAIMPVSLDHTEILGDTVAKIAAEKAGVLRERTLLVLAPQPPAARAVILQRAERLQCPVVEIGRDVLTTKHGVRDGKQIYTLNFVRQDPRRAYENLPLGLAGAHQLDNAAAAFGLADSPTKMLELSPDKFLALAATVGQWRRMPAETEITPKEVELAWRDLVVPGRFETVAAAPRTIIDGAHNAASGWALAETLRETCADDTPKIAVIGMSRDKKIAEFLRVVVPFFDYVFFTQSANGRAAAPEFLREEAVKLFPERAERFRADFTPITATLAAQVLAGERGLVCVAGSFYLIGELRMPLLAEKFDTPAGRELTALRDAVRRAVA